MLRKASKFAAVLLVLAMAALPVAACMAPEWQMTAEERQCCEKMAHSCEAAAMPNSHSCCQHPISLQTIKASRIGARDFILLPATPIETQLLSPRHSVRRILTEFESPPENPPPSITVLRI